MLLGCDLSYVKEYLRPLSGLTIMYFPNPGNAGDSLIAAATYQVFRRLNLRVTVANEATDVTNSVTIYGGGGNLVPLYGNARETIRRAMPHAQLLVLLPHTIRGHDTFLGELPTSATVFCREPDSYRYVIEHTKANVYLDHDMAFHLDIGAFYEYCKRYSNAKIYFEKRLPAITQCIEGGQGIAHFMRTDEERISHAPQAPYALDLSKICEFGVMPDNAEESVYCMFEAIKRASKVVTDRLHVAIACGILGKECELFDNNYGKNRGIYFHSIRKFYPSVTFRSYLSSSVTN